METIIKIKDLNLRKLNNAEFTQFLSYTKELIEKATLEKLGLNDQPFETLKEHIDLMTDMLQQSRISSETKILAEIDKQRNEILSFLLMNFRSEQKNPIEKRKKAGTELYNITKPYQKIKTLPMRQKTQMIEGLITDITKQGISQYITTLGIKEAVDKLSSYNAEYKKLTANRADFQESVKKVDVNKLRKEMTNIYDYLITKSFVTSVANPSDESRVFVNAINKLITDTNLAYKLRKAQKKDKSGSTEDISN